MARPRVVITGLAGLSPLGLDMATTWDRIKAGESGIGPITLFDATEYDSKVAGEVKDFDPTRYVSAKQARHMDRFTQFASAAGSMLMEDSGFVVTPENEHSTGVIMGVGLGGLRTIEIYQEKLLKSGPNKISPFMIPMLISNMGPGELGIKFGIKGPNYVTTSACASASHALGTAYSEMVLGRVRACISGGCEATVTPLGVAGFTALKALSTHFNDNPTMSSRPFDKDRDGFVIGEGCGLLMLELLEDAQARGAKIYAEIVGYGASCDAYHMTAPEPDGTGMEWAMRNALKDAGIAPEAVGHINAHATSTKQGDVIETRAMKKVFGDHAKNLHISATKSMTGHLLGAAGGIEACFTALALKEEIIPPTINLENADEECDLDYTPNKANHVACEYALCNSFGFGGTNASIVLKKWTD
ncbi:beta-ketoacyl-[acyl-carrier-protein] synthase II [Desulfovibrio sp. An276]|uniref:beta-ketoacyl-ACP synthase II n=1 Tax=Desulfovibrio sp. An276 TaxID=1965618 RepID=UPI000B3A8A9C|nr:beta-ketoacyl-ACP synthase II [Desulfovibrio sp. An276]OUO55065.1 beta-ketoacyl-[acyl-carrier-protein] synthase II [Desulfovibrio sp. An276]